MRKNDGFAQPIFTGSNVFFQLVLVKGRYTVVSCNSRGYVSRQSAFYH